MNLRRNTLWNLAGAGVPLVAAIIFIPRILSQLGNEAFGLLTLIWALIGYFSLFDIGIGRALTYRLSKLNAATDDMEISATLKAGLVLVSLAGSSGLLLLILIAPTLVEDWLKISTALQMDAILAFKVAAIGIIPTTITTALRGASEGLGEFANSNLNRIFLGICMFILPPIAIEFHGASLWIITCYLVAARLLTAIMISLHFRKYLLANSLGVVKHFRLLFNYGFWITVSGIIGPLMVYGDRFFVGSLLGAAALPVYAIPQEGLQRLLMIPSALCNALMPEFSATTVASSKAAYYKAYRFVALSMLGLCILVGLLAYPAMSFWISSQFAEDALPITLVLLIGIWINSMAFVPYTFLHANEKPKVTAIFHIIELLIYCLMLYYLARHFGLLGAAIAWTLRVGIDWVLLHYEGNRLIRKSK